MKKATQCLVALALLVAVGCGQSTDGNVKTAGERDTSDSTSSAPPEARATTQQLFVIQRSKNANEVHYDARLTAEGRLDPEQPVIAYWVLLAEDGRRQELNWIERQKAYGFTIEPDPSTDAYTMTLVPLREREITVRKAGGEARAELAIDGHRAVLERVYIESSGGLFGPKVHYVKLFGKDLQTGEERVEKIVPE